jgi:hypothetical protein
LGGQPKRDGQLTALVLAANSWIVIGRPLSVCNTCVNANRWRKMRPQEICSNAAACHKFSAHGQ